ncbi:MAG: M28 family peptidase [Longimicrobiales bacterium]|nr:M28 family peptidase [Longimicrobiales bacterium]
MACVLVLSACAEAERAGEIDGVRLMHDLEVISADSLEGRAVGTEGNAAARGWIVSRLAGLEVEVDSQDFVVGRAGGGDDLRGVNLVARLPGADPSRGAPFVISAHYDHLGVRDGEIYNGADDNASGSAALLAFAGALRDAPLDHDVLLLFLDAEERGLQGARAFLQAAGGGAADRFALNLNLDMVSRSSRDLWVAGTHQNPALRPIVEGVEEADGVVLRFGHDGPEWVGADNWTHASDHGPFHDAGVPFLYFGVEDHADYHRPSDDAVRVDAGWYRASVETILRVVRALDRAPGALSAAREARARQRPGGTGVRDGEG